jgi:hypothetical protein
MFRQAWSKMDKIGFSAILSAKLQSCPRTHGHILRHLGEFGKIRLLPGEITRGFWLEGRVSDFLPVTLY